MALTQRQVSELYVAIFNRASEGEGNKYWQTKEATSAATADAMLATTDAKTYFGTSLDTNKAFIEHIYLNTLNKTYAQDKAGVDYWVSQLDAGKSRGEVVAELVYAVSTYKDSTDPVTKAAYDQFNNRVDVSNYMAITVEKAPADYDKSTKFATTGTTGLVVTNSASTVTTAKTSVDALKPVDGTTFTLTTGVDTFTGADKADLFKGSVSTLTSDNTLNPTDTLDGGAGIDTLKVNVNSNFTGFTTGSVKNIENIELTNVSSVAREFDATGITGVTKYTINANNNAGVNLVDLDKTVDVSVSNIKDTATFTTAFNASAKELTGTSDAMNLAISSLGVVDDAATTVNEEKVVNVTLNSIETANVSATNSNVISFAGTDLKALNISGAGNVKVNTVTTSLTSVDASASTGAIDIDTTATTSTLTSVKTGSGNDKVKLNTADILANGTISLGAGEDTLTLASAAAGGKTVQYTLSGAETLALDGVTTALTFSGANVSGLTTVSTVSTNSAATSLVNMGTQALTVDNKGATVNGGALSSDHTGATTLNYKADAASITAKTAQNSLADYTFDNSAAALTVNVNEYTDTSGSVISAAKATSVTLNVASGKDSSTTPVEVTEFDGIITAAKATSVTVNATGKLGTSAVITAAEAKTATITNGATAGTLQYVGAATTDLTLKSGSKFTFATSTDLSAVQNASFTMDKGDLSFTTAANGNLVKASSVTVAGADDTSKITLGDLGQASNDYGLTLTASGLKGGLTVGSLAVNAGYDINAVVAGVKGNTLIAAAGTIGTVAKNITVDAQKVGGTLTLGAITGTGAVTVKLDGTSGPVTLGTITGKTVNLDASDTIGGVATKTYAVTATDSATIAVSSLESSTVGVTAGTGSTALTVALTGGIENDALTITTVATSTSVVVTGDLGLGTDTVNLSDTTYANTAGTMTKDISGLLNYETATITGKNGFKDTLKGGAGVDTITGGTGADILTGGASADKFVFTAGDSLVAASDKITDFNTGNVKDVIDHSATLALGGSAAAATAGNASISAGGKATFVAADNTLALKIAAVAADLDAGAAAAGRVAFFEDSGNTYVFITDANATNTTGDDLIELTGVTGLTAITVDGSGDVTIA